jgi:methylglyoxal synthase
MVSRAQTVEDGGPRRPPFVTLHHSGTAKEFIRIAMVVRQPYALRDFTAQLVIRASQVTGEVTVALESLRTE